MPSFKITLAYDGTDFVGWQRQASGTSIQGLLEEALRAFDDRDVTVIGAGRTDAGVHALGQVAAFSLARAIDAETVVRALNARLPDAVRVLAANEVSPAFNARFDARTKTYRYRLWNGPVASPFERRYAWHVAGALDVDAMCAAAQLLEGRHDFAAFQAAGSDVATTEREIFVSRIEECGLRIDCGLISNKSAIRPSTSSGRPAFVEGRNPRSAILEYEITGDGFLRHMVRTIVGTLVEIGRGRRRVEWIDEVIASRHRAAAGPTAPAHGLFLVAVEYGGALASKP